MSSSVSAKGAKIKSLPANPTIEAALTRTNQERASAKWKPLETAEEVMKFSRHYIYARGALNNRFRRLLAMLEAARDELQDIADIDADYEIRKEWREAGLPELTAKFRDDVDCDDEGESAHRTIEHAGYVIEDANGAAWALGAFISTLESYVAGGRAKAEDDEGDSEEETEEVPHVVHACC